MAETEKSFEQQMMASMVGASSLLILLTVMDQLLPKKTYCCPIDTGLCFYTYEELYNHFVTAHPSESIDISWS